MVASKSKADASTSSPTKSISSSYQLANGTLGEYVNMSSFGVIDIQNGGLVTLAGTLDILLQSGFNPAVGSTYEFITFTPGDLRGVFSNIQNAIFNGGTEKWTVVYGNSGGYVELLAQSNSTTTPEPGSFLLLGTGLLGLAYSIRGRYTQWVSVEKNERIKSATATSAGNYDSVDFFTVLGKHSK